jgi:hypothetical protein
MELMNCITGYKEHMQTGLSHGKNCCNHITSDVTCYSDTDTDSKTMENWRRRRKRRRKKRKERKKKRRRRRRNKKKNKRKKRKRKKNKEGGERRGGRRGRRGRGGGEGRERRMRRRRRRRGLFTVHLVFQFEYLIQNETSPRQLLTQQ